MFDYSRECLYKKYWLSDYKKSYFKLLLELMNSDMGFKLIFK